MRSDFGIPSAVFSSANSLKLGALEGLMVLRSFLLIIREPNGS